ncbi:MAG: O-antigen ligase family protein [Mariniphaga sp.]|nr:O-antigen ligase family protein [Mariniphaga sp.]MDD4425045.1 O-antigen ligase family protein [Mariniphaga sp.]
MNQKIEKMNKWREITFFFLLVFSVISFPFSEALVSINAGLLLFQALILSSWKHPSVKNRSWMILLFPLSIFAVYFAGTFFTLDFNFALYELNKNLFWIIIPLAVYLSPKLSEKKINILLLIFVASVILASFISTGKLLMHSYTRILEFRSTSSVSHIRFSLQVVLSIILLSWFLMQENFLKSTSQRFLFLIAMIWLTCFLFLLKSLLGILAFLGTLMFALLFFVRRINIFKWRALLVTAFVLVLLIPVIFTGRVIYDFFDFKEVDPDTVEYFSPSGNKYHHDFEDKTRENGYLVYTYICDEELRREWNKLSKKDYDELLNGFPLSITLIRYLTSMGVRKDSAGVSVLTAGDVALIEDGITNCNFKNSYFSLYPRIYETIWEVDNYIRTGDPNNKSLAQRIEFVRASALLIKKNPLFGIGTGNWILKYNEVYDEMQSLLMDEKRGPSHNQYLNYMVKFGVTGLIWILFALLYPFFKTGNRSHYIFILFLISFAFANLGDANMETHMGLSFFVFFYSLFLWNSTEEMKGSIQ